MHAKRSEILLLNNFANICKLLSGVYTPWKPCLMFRTLIGGIYLVYIEYTETNLFAICSVFLKELHRQAVSLTLNCISATKFN